MEDAFIELCAEVDKIVSDKKKAGLMGKTKTYSEVVVSAATVIAVLAKAANTVAVTLIAPRL
jgi:hypothetical protein